MFGNNNKNHILDHEDNKCSYINLYKTHVVTWIMKIIHSMSDYHDRDNFCTIHVVES